MVGMPGIAWAQTTDSRTSEDAITRLLNNPAFMQKLGTLSANQLTPAALEGYVHELVPEYATFRLNVQSLDLNHLYYANVQNLSMDQLSNNLGQLLGVKPENQPQLRAVLSGNLGSTLTPAQNLSLAAKEVGNSLYARGQSKNVDYAVDYSVDFFQKQFGDGGLNSALIDIGGGLLGKMFLNMEKKEQEADFLLKVATVQVRYTKGIFGPGDQDLDTNFKADKELEKRKFTEAIGLYNQAIEAYKSNPERSYYLYNAYLNRGRAKMELGSYRTAITDYYYAQSVLQFILEKKLPDYSIKTVYPTGYTDGSNKNTYRKGNIKETVGTLSVQDFQAGHLFLAYAKYRAADYLGAIADCDAGLQDLAQHQPDDAARPNNGKSMLLATKAMALFELKRYPEAETAFAAAQLDPTWVGDKDQDATTNFRDTDSEGQAMMPDFMEGIVKPSITGLPDYYPFDVNQVRGLAYYKAGQYNEAIALYEQICPQAASAGRCPFTGVGGDISAVYNTLGNFYLTKGDKQKALTFFNNAISINPSQPEYYASLANCKQLMGDVAGASAETQAAANPELAKTKKKTQDYYASRMTSLTAANQADELVDLMMEAAVSYPENVNFFDQLVLNLNKTKNATQALVASSALKNEPMKYHVLQLIHSRYSGDVAGEEQHLTQAFDNNLSFYRVDKYYRLRITQRPYYCQLMSKYASPTNNTLHDRDADPAKGKHMLDSVYATVKTAAMPAAFRKMMDSMKRKAYAQIAGDYEAVLAVLDEDDNTDKVPYNALEKIECLFILKRPEKVAPYAKKAFAESAKFSGIANFNRTPANNERYELSDEWLEALRNFAQNPCVGK